MKKSPPIIFTVIFLYPIFIHLITLHITERQVIGTGHIVNGVTLDTMYETCDLMTGVSDGGGGGGGAQRGEIPFQCDAWTSRIT